MKRTVQFRSLITFLLIPFLASALSNPMKKGKYTKEKTINKEYSVSSSVTLKIDNSYGNLDIITWNENKIVFEITITTTGNDEDKVERKLNNIDIKFSASKNWVAAETLYNKKNTNNWWKGSDKNNVKMKIDYIVKMPISGKINLNNNYGNINVEKLEGNAEINCDYGKIITKELMADGNILNFDYSNGCYFEYVKSGKINADYSSFTVGKTERLDFNADYTTSKIESAESLHYNCDYGSLIIKSASEINGNSDYLTIKIGEIKNSATLKAGYGSIIIEKLQNELKALNLNSSYTGVKIGYDSTLNFDFNVDLQYANFNGGDGFNFIYKSKESTRKKYSGYYGNKNSGTVITINSQYGGVNFYKN